MKQNLALAADMRTIIVLKTSPNRYLSTRDSHRDFLNSRRVATR